MNGHNTGDESRRKDGRISRFCARHAFRPSAVKTMLAVIIVLFVLAGVLTAGVSTFISSRTTKLGLKNIGELATQAGYFTSVQTIKENREVLGVAIPGTYSNYIFSYDGVIKAGFDFEKIEYSVDEAEKTIHIKLPEAEILSVEIDESSFKLYNDGENIFTPLKMEKVNMALAKLKETARQTATDNGLLDNAVANAKVLITGFLAGSFDMNKYTVVFE